MSRHGALQHGALEAVSRPSTDAVETIDLDLGVRHYRDARPPAVLDRGAALRRGGRARAIRAGGSRVAVGDHRAEGRPRRRRHPPRGRRPAPLVELVARGAAGVGREAPTLLVPGTVLVWVPWWLSTS